jgi:PAS domain S-box-containing protein
MKRPIGKSGPHGPTHWLTGGGEMGEIIRSTDWSATPLGGLETWPKTLRIATDLVLASRFPMAILWGKELIFVYNDAYRVIAGEKHPAAIGRPTCEVWPEVWEFSRPILEKVMLQGETVYLKDQLLRLVRGRDPEDAYFTLSYSPIRTEDGGVGGTLVTLIETTEQILAGAKMEEALRESEANYRELVETANSIIIRMDVGGRITFLNRYARGFFGYSREEIIGRNVRILLPRTETYSGRDLQEMVGKLLENPDGFVENINENVRKNGERVWISWRNKAVRDSEGNVIGNLAVGQDITGRKKAEEEQVRLLEALRREKEKVSAILNSVSDEIWFADTGKEFTLINSSGLREFGIDTTEAGIQVEELAASLEVLRPDGTPRPIEEAPPLRALRGEVIRNQEEIVRTPGKGELRYRQVSSTPVRDAGGTIIGSVSVVRDITDRKRAEEALRKARDELEVRVRERTAELARANEDLQAEIVKREETEQQLFQVQKLESLGTLAGGIAHDFNNIIGAIVINSEMALLDLPEESGVRNNLKLILRSGLRGKDLVSRMLLFSRKSERRLAIITLTPLIKDTLRLLRASLPTTIQLNFFLQTESDAVHADPSQILQVVMNLCTNAAHAMRGKTGSIDISLRCLTLGSTELPEEGMQPGAYLVFSVKDTGCGMDTEVRKRIFEPFFTTKPVGEGTGLGLAVVYGIVKSHNGHITVQSEPGKGSVFEVYLPKVDARGSEKTEPLSPVPEGNENVLFVDDDEFIAHSVRSMLERVGYRVTALTDSEEALKLFSEDPSQFDLVMTDQTMPFKTGEELGREMMRMRPDIPIILCTGYSESISPEKVMAMGFRGFILKPFTIREGAEMVRQVLDRKKDGKK